MSCQLANRIMTCHYPQASNSDPISLQGQSPLVRDRQPSRVLIAWSLLPHERRMSVVNLTMRRLASALRATAGMAAIAQAANDAMKPNLSDEVYFGEEACGLDECRMNAVTSGLSSRGLPSGTRLIGQNESLNVSDLAVRLPLEAEPIKNKEAMLWQVRSSAHVYL
ncbi:unnamed protein product [Protopolystoma xenopodis]|uniref:Uncharacterized protein n=1 Tax=Protopolystoma xenopodis TaxID=117903 RepID=A0A3S5ACC1_9PLAT|nr:unnamed protein product [Protopolystoma xenopodis]